MLYFLGQMMFVIGAVMLVPAFLAPFLNELHTVPSFLAPAIACFLLGLLITRKTKQRSEPSLGEMMAMTAALWIIFAAFASIPFMTVARMSPADAYFESMSGLTATGLTMIENVDGMERTLLFWRSLTQWVGGLGVIVLFLSAVVSFGRAHRKMYFAEAHPILIMPSIRDTARALWKIYMILTAAGAVILYFASWPNSSAFEAVNHAMTAIATGGFSVRGSSFSAYGLAAKLSVLLLMVWGATNFTVHDKVLHGRLNIREFFRNIEVRFMLILIAFSTLMLLWSVGPVDALFQTTSALTGTGFSTASIANWGDMQKGLLVVLMMIGGSYGSTSSAIKLIRVLLLGKTILWMIRKSFLPERAVVPMKLGGHIYTEKEIMEVVIYIFIYIILIFVGAGILMVLGYPPMNSIFESASAQGNVGLTTGITSASMPLAGKISLTFQMLVGRLEILPILALLGYAVSKAKREPIPF